MSPRFPPLAPQEPNRRRLPSVLQALPLGELGVATLLGLVLLLA